MPSPTRTPQPTQDPASSAVDCEACESAEAMSETISSKMGTETDAVNRLVPATLATVTAITLVSFLGLWISTISGNGEEDGGQGGPEAERGAKLSAACVWMAIMAAVVGFIGFAGLRDKGEGDAEGPTRYSAGLTMGSAAMYGIMALLASSFFWNLGQREDRGERFLEDGGEERDREAEEEHAELMFSILCLVVMFLYFGLAGVVRSFGKSASVVGIKEDGLTSLIMARFGGRAEVLRDAWGVMSITTVILTIILLPVAIIPLFLEEGERMREEGYVYNFIFITIWLLLLSVFLLLAGRRVFRTGAAEELECGGFNGCLISFSGLCTLLFVLYGNFQFEERRREDGPFGSGMISMLCLLLAGVYTAFAVGMYRYHRAVVLAGPVRDNATDGFVLMDNDDGRKKRGWKLPWTRGQMA